MRCVNPFCSVSPDSHEVQAGCPGQVPSRDFHECECEPKYVRAAPVHTKECDDEYVQFMQFKVRKQAFHDAVARGEVPEILK